MKAERNTEMWRIPPVPKLLATPKPFATPKPILQAAGPATPVQHKRPTLCIMTPSTQSKKDRSLNNPNDFNYNVCILYPFKCICFAECKKLLISSNALHLSPLFMLTTSFIQLK